MNVFQVSSGFEMFRNEDKVINKPHHKFGHAKTHKLARPIEHSSMFRELTKTNVSAIIENVVNNCEECQDEEERYRRKNSEIREV